MAMNKIRRNGSYAPLSAHYYKDDAIDEAGEAAELLYVRGLAFCADVLSDGFISDRQLIRFVGVGMFDAPDRAIRLVEVGLWENVEGGYRVRSWLDWNRSRADITDAQAKDAARKGRSGPSGGSERPDPDPPNGGGQNSDRIPNGFRAESETTTAGSPTGVHPHAGARARSPRLSTPRLSTPLHDMAEPAIAAADAAESVDARDGLFEAPEPIDPPASPDRFDEFWELWPNKVKKQGARDSWRVKVTEDRVDVGVLLSALRSQIVAWQTHPRYPEFVPHPTTWLNGRRWHDEVNQRPALRAVSGESYRPYANPPESAYDEPMYPQEGQ